jgi:hypothetical protein
MNKINMLSAALMFGLVSMTGSTAMARDQNSRQAKPQPQKNEATRERVNERVNEKCAPGNAACENRVKRKRS